MILNLMTSATIKTQLGIAAIDTTYDAAITAMIPIVSNDIRRILNCNYDNYVYATLTNGSDEMVLNTGYYSVIDIPQEVYNMGQVVYSPALPADTYIESFDPISLVYTLSADATAAGTYIYPTLGIGQWPAVAKMIFYKIGKQTTSAATATTYKSVKYGNVSKTFSDSEINKKYDYPTVYLNELGAPYAKVG